MTDNHLSQLIRRLAGDQADDILDTLQIDRALMIESAGPVSRGVFSMALCALLFQDLLNRVPSGAAYVADRRRQRERIVFDHAALKTVRFGSNPTGALPGGAAAFTRILEPLGYRSTGVYPLDDLRMTGRSFTHRDYPEALPQFFISELQVDRFSKDFHGAAERVFGASRDPLTVTTHSALAEFTEQGRCEMKLAATALKELLSAFGRCHEMPEFRDYRLLLAESPEGAWISTEGYCFNHVTDRVCDVAMTACAQRSIGRPVKGCIQTSVAGTVRQTALKADLVRRSFRAEDGSAVELSVPGSYYEFISRDQVTGADGRKRIDLRFGNDHAQGVFKMTAAG